MPDGEGIDRERNRLAGRLGRFGQVGVNIGGAAASMAASRLIGGAGGNKAAAEALRAALGRTRGPLMKVAQMIATIPEALPEEFAQELAQLQSNAPDMGWPFVKRRMRAELGADWEARFASFEQKASHAASLGQVHRAVLHDGRAVACKLQYPDMASAVESDIGQLKTLLGLFKATERAIDPSDGVEEIADRLREELDYGRERQHMALYARLLAPFADIAVPEPVDELSSGRLLTMTWLTGGPILAYKDSDQATRNRIATLLFNAWWVPMTGSGVIHGDPHLGNYTVTEGAKTLNLLDFGCVRIFPPKFVEGVVALYRALLADDIDGCVAAYEIWGFEGLTKDLVEVLNLWARFIYGPLMDDRVRTIADGISPGQYGRKEAFKVRDLLRAKGPVKIPREFVFMDRAAIGLGAAFLHMRAELNFYQMFQTSIEGFDRDVLAARQRAALDAVGL
ncbi:MAG: AarF/ABC1/UbiB kinase family protein [Hyphomonadaceae bacterium]|jgi:predicted unusual protein kinase regulating ubiquinone biosynthesis (AarF/ABC1/UbiB family)|nr:AarF/ABC1/UbiB kinase family protein [Hyphomonadaceae bacterium]